MVACVHCTTLFYIARDNRKVASMLICRKDILKKVYGQTILRNIFFNTQKSKPPSRRCYIVVKIKAHPSVGYAVAYAIKPGPKPPPSPAHRGAATH